ncbi:unnamed protein product [Chilo suppressalis]|uniref:Elongator complex protein 1 n=1 Tax=Chilo suppressalis TaxID=168631 RepID=A0ABN8L645_CHISP|nr:unnamed protein product [Chilo suppressalis]
MRNLNLWEVASTKVKSDANENLTICYTHNESNCDELYTCSYNLIVSNFRDNGDVKWSKDLSEIVMNSSKPVNITYLSLLNTLCVGLENGEIVTLAESGEVCDLAGVCEKGILAMEWSPDQELLVLVTKELNTILMSCTYDPINEVNLLNQEFGEKQFITVGWGKKETQFHGSEGKQAARAKTEISADPLSNVDDTVKISWRGDGNLYVIGFTMEGIRRFKVFDREGHLQYTSEKQQGLESNLSWRPSGNVIATTQKINGQYLVSFFEKNGLKHGSFDIPVNSDTTVEDITWSTDSEILTLQCRNTVTDSQKLLLFTSSNYHWYHKQTLVYSCEQKIKKIVWDNDFDVTNNKKLHVFLNSGEHFCYSWIWNVDHSRGHTNDDDAVVAVIDGTKVLLTGFRQTVVPPPMAADEVKCDFPINSVHFAPQTVDGVCSHMFFAVTPNNKLIFYKQKCKFPLEYLWLKTISVVDNKFPFQYYNWFWMNSYTIVCVTLGNNGDYRLMEYRIESDEIVEVNSAELPKSVTRIQAHPKELSKLFLQANNGEIIKYYEGGSAELQDMSFGVSCPKFNAVIIDETLYFIGLTHKNNLFLNGTMILNGVNSFYVHTHFLLLTTLQHVLLCTELTHSGINALTEYQKNESTENIYKRKIERGAKLVIVVPNDTRTIFQMPRGNLEAIQPRPLSLKLIGEHLDALKYYEAFDIMRKQRINLNLIYDHDPDKFVQNIDTFLDSVQNNSWLSLFLSDLENIDVTKTMYASSYNGNLDKVRSDTSSKVNILCDILKLHLNQRSDSESKILPILTAFVKKNTEHELENALTLIKELKLKESGGSKLPVGSEEALKYLLYMVDVNKLFDVALGMYDFDLVLQVANKSQKDPKEFIPMLNELNEMDKNYKKFSINKHLKRYSKAVKSLVMCGPEKYDELKTFVKYHSLYREALGLFSTDEEIYKVISNDFGVHLRLKKQYIEAGIVFERAGNYENAIECYKDALEWELAVKIAHKMYSPEQFMEFCWELINTLKEEKRHQEALQILEQYYKDIDKTISYAIECGQYKTAYRLCAQYNKDELKEKYLLPAVLEEYKNLKELIESNWSTFIKHKERLCVVRENKSKQPMDMYESAYYNKDSDLYSDAGSTLASSSRGSSRSFRSSKNRRKHERKVASLKEGSQYEDVALIMALHSLVTSSFDLRLQVKNVNIALGCMNKDTEAFILQTSLDKLLKEMKDSFKDIWTNELVIESTNAVIAAQNVPEGSSVIPQGIATLEPHIRIAPVIHDVSWKLEGLN